MMAANLKTAATAGLVALIFGLLGCSDWSEKQLLKAAQNEEERSEASQQFVKMHYVRPRGRAWKPPHDLDRYPARLFGTKLRPSLFTARVPTPYLVILTHRWQPYAKTIWDTISIIYDVDTLAPLLPAPAPQRLHNAVKVELGGYTASMSWLNDRTTLKKSKIFPVLSETPAEIVRDVAGHKEHIIYVKGENDLDGSPIIIACNVTCSTRLTISTKSDYRKMTAMKAATYKSDGIGVRVSFDEVMLPHWGTIRRDALCFVGEIVSDFHRPDYFFPDHGACNQVRMAIEKEMARTLPPEKRS